MHSHKKSFIGAILLFCAVGLVFSVEQKQAAPAAQTPTAAPQKAAAPTATPATQPTAAAPATQKAASASATQPTAAAPAPQKAAAAPAASPGAVEVWAPADEADWAVYMDAPAYHFALAKEYLQKGEAAKAAAELKRANEFINFQRSRLALASKQIEKLITSVSTGKEKDLGKIDSVAAKTLKVIDYKFAMLPVEVGAASLFADEYKYHFDRAKTKLLANDQAGAANEIKRAVSFLKLKAAHVGHQAKADLDAITTELKDLAAKVESGTVKGVKELDQVFQKAATLFAKKK